MTADAATFVILVAFSLGFASSCSRRDCGPEHWLDLATHSDLHYVSYTGDNLWYLADSIGAGLAAGDYDGDGRPDLLLLTGSAVVDKFKAEAAQHTNALWRNEIDRDESAKAEHGLAANATFRDVTKEAGLGSSEWSTGAVMADYDGDGDLDFFLACQGPNRLWRNNGDGSFSDVAKQAGVNDPRWAAAGSFADFDGDGDLDLYVTNYAIYDIEQEKDTVSWFTLEQFPQFFEPCPNILYRNNGDGTFTDITDKAGVAGNGRGMTALATDVDDDGDPDLFVANDIGFNELFLNVGDMKFTDISLESGVSCDSSGVFQASMGAAAADYDEDGDMDIMVTNYGAEYHTLYRNEGDGLFTDVTAEAGLVSREVLDTVGWGVGLFDFDLDGHLDILSVNGHVVLDYVVDYMAWWGGGGEQGKRFPHMQTPAYNMGANQPNLLFLGNGDASFHSEHSQHGTVFCQEYMSRGAAFADFDDDGRMDVAISNKNQPLQILLNRIPRRGNWFKLRLRDREPNVFAVGARVRVETIDRVWNRELLAGSSYCSSNDNVVHVGLGAAERVERVTVRWPDRSIEVFGPLAVNTTHHLKRGSGEMPFSPQPSSANTSGSGNR